MESKPHTLYPFSFQKEIKPGFCEDAPPVATDRYAIVCDGLGGAGHTKHSLPDEENPGTVTERTSAYLGSRIVADRVERFFAEHWEEWASSGETPEIGVYAGQLKEELDRAIQDYVEKMRIRIPVGKTIKIFPTTLASAVFLPCEDGLRVAAIWAGDSRVYLLTPSKGLRLLSLDDADGAAEAIKTGVLKAEGRQTLSNLLVYLVVPAMIVHSYMMDFSEEILHNLLAAFGLSVLAILIGTVLTLALTARQKDRRAPIFRFASVFSNAAYMGFPLISALFGSEGLLYASAYVTVFNILLWTMGYGMVSGSSSPKEVARSLLRTPVLYAMVVGLAVYLLQIPVPALIAQPLELLSNMNTPLSMLITGILIATGDLKQIVCDRHIWKLAGLRMLVIPAVCLAAFAALGLLRFGMSAQVVLLLECCPAAAITSVFAVQFGHDEQFAAGCVVLTTLLSIVTLPLCALVLTALM